MNSSESRIKVIGILGGGQLAAMTIDAAHKLGYKVHVFSDVEDSVAFINSDYQTKADYNDISLIRQFAESVDVITYEFENIPKETVSFLERNYVLRPNAKSLEICQRRYLEKSFVNNIGIGTAKFQSVRHIDDVKEFLSLYGGAILKTDSMGYDGKGQFVLNSVSGITEVEGLNFTDTDFIIEEKLNFIAEISVLIARNSNGIKRGLPITRNIHKRGILDKTIFPSGLDILVQDRAAAMAERIVDELNYIGILAVEMFVMPDNSLLINELAPRPHNSGHWTIDACNYSQFEMFVRAITNMDMPEVVATYEAEMVNLLGDEINNVGQLRQDTKIRVHDYGKKEAKPGRKMGHYTILHKGY